ncbi:hypothetical protein WMF31_11435 [Sorangium sp. So ce1036]|uniref:hypothetical protein n=1 Tax=Sorangium sp. So ce1036 TaxID=3133328 RepID=UPI003EFCA02D
MKRAALLPLALLAACASAPAPQPAPAAPLHVAARPDGAEPAAARPAEARPVSAPAELMMVLRVADPRRTWQHATQHLASTPFGQSLLRAGPMGPDLLLGRAIGPALADMVDLGKPLDVAVLDVASPRFVFSLSVPEERVPRLHERFVLEKRSGLLRVERAREADAGAPPRACAFEPGERRGSARLLCAEGQEDLEVTAPYLVEVVGREPLEADARLEMPESGIREAMERGRATRDDGAESYSARMGRETGERFVGDIEDLRLDVTWGRADVEVGLGLRFASQRSPLTRAIVPAAVGGAALPPAFLRLPADTALALYTQGASRAELTPLRDTFFGWLRDDMVRGGYDAARLDRFFEHLGALVFTGGPVVFGAGGDRAAAEKALAAYQGGGKGAQRAQAAARRALQGWFLVAIEEPGQTWTAGVKELLQLGDELDQHRAPGAGTTGDAPDGRKRGDRAPRSPQIVLARAPAALPAGTIHAELRSRPAAKDGPPASTTHVYVVPAGQRTWIGVGKDDAAVVARLRVATEAGRDARTLGAAPGVEALRQRGLHAGALLSLAGCALLAARGDTPAKLSDAAETLALVAALPSRGESAIPVTVTSEVLGSGAARVSTRARLSPAALQDIITLLSR